MHSMVNIVHHHYHDPFYHRHQFLFHSASQIHQSKGRFKKKRGISFQVSVILVVGASVFSSMIFENCPTQGREVIK